MADYQGPERRKGARRWTEKITSGASLDYAKGKARIIRNENELPGMRGMGSRGHLGTMLPEAHSGGGMGIATLDHAGEKVPRRLGAGRRKGDLARAISRGEEVTFDLSKMGRVGKLARKAGKLGMILSAGAAVYDMVNKQKQ